MVKDQEKGLGGREWFRRKRMVKEERRSQEEVYLRRQVDSCSEGERRDWFEREEKVEEKVIEDKMLS